jgi:hypothetical protein
MTGGPAMSREPSLLCREMSSRDPLADIYDPRAFTSAEWELLSRTGYIGERDGISVLSALRVWRRGTLKLPGQIKPSPIEWHVIAFRCPWSPLKRVLTDPPGFQFDADGARSLHAWWELDEHGCYRLLGGGCPVNPDCFISPFADSSLPCRSVPWL